MQLVIPEERDLDALMTMMEAFNRYESIVWTRAQGEAPLRTLIGDPSLGFVVLAREAADAPNLGYAVVTFGFDLEWGGRDAFLTELWLEPEARGRGVGARVLAAVEARAKAQGAHALHLMVRHANANAQALYRRAGYTVPDRLFMTRRLS
jgi:ribosomal protein S18 acetylase RimI-like enzyme